MKRSGLLAGDRVVVRSAHEILSTLDAHGALDDLPFMPEMLDWCGKPFRVQRRVEKTCVAVDPPLYPNRRFASNDVVLLDGPRCDGQAHDGCRRSCRIFWKEEWLRRVESAPAPARIGEAGLAVDPGLAELRARLKVRADEQRYFCQSTELCNATEAFPGKKKVWMARIAFREIGNGDRSAAEIARQFVLWCRYRLLRARTRGQWLRGPDTRTPSESLDLKPGDIVRVKSRDQIVQTLDRKSRNRGMSICYEMTRCCGAEAEVGIRVERIIDEKSGKMQQLQNTVMLRNLRGNPALCDECLCHDEMGDCPRGELMYWREIWLERAGDGVS